MPKNQSEPLNDERGRPSAPAIVTKDLSTLTAAPYNPRKISPEAMAGLQFSLKKFGLVQPIVVNKRTGHVVGGHQRVAALLQNGETSAQCIEVDISEVDEQALNITLNNPHIAGEFTDDLQAILDQLHTAAPDLIEPLNLNDLWNGSAFAQGNTDPDEVPPVPETPITKLGDVWKLGEHRVMCGDALGGALDIVLDGKKPAMLWSDPPYGLGGYAGRSGKFVPVEGDDAPDDRLREFFKIGSADEMYICCEFKTFRHLIGARGTPRSLIVWAKNSFGMGNGYRRQHEFVGYWGDYKGTTESDLWSISREKDYEHPTQKPVALPIRAIRNSTIKGDIVFDPFCGSGTALIAAEQAGRACYGIEIDPAYCDVIVKRWENFTGQKATLETT